MSTANTGWSRSKGSTARDRTREAILETALRLFAERGYVQVRVEDMAREAGVSRATFYKHFAEREQILASLFERLLGNVSEVTVPTDGDTEARVRALLDDVVERMLGDEVLARFVYSIPVRHDAVLPGGAAVPVVFTHIREVLEGAVAAGEVRDDVPLDRVMEMLGRAFEAAMRDWAEGRADDPRAPLDEMLHILFGGLLPRSA